jgi:HEAT repeat protein
MKTRRKWIAIAMAGLVILGIGFALLDPEARVRGWVNGEPSFQGRYASAWRSELRQSDEIKSTAAREALTQGKGEAVPVCVWLLEHAEESEVRARSADALKRMGPEAKPAGDALVKALDDPDPIVRAVALQAIDAMAPDLPAGALGKLLGLFPDVDAIKAVAKFGPAAKEAIPRLAELLNHKEASVRFQSAKALGKIGAASVPHVPELIRLMGSDPDDKVREISAEVIGQLGPAAAAAFPQAVPALAKALKDPAWNVRRDAVRSLGQLGPAAKGVLNEVKTAVKDGNELVRTAAATAVRKIEATAK